jgi:predicted GNAT family N-acyltransferase
MIMGVKSMDYRVIQEFEESQLLDIHKLFKNEWWTQNRELNDIKQLVANSGVVLGVISNETGELVGFARVITDSLYRAFIFDVIANEQYRNTGIGKLLMNSILTHPKVVNVDRIELYCPDRLIHYYEKFGFSTDVNGSTLMRYKK